MNDIQNVVLQNLTRQKPVQKTEKSDDKFRKTLDNCKLEHNRGSDVPKKTPEEEPDMDVQKQQMAAMQLIQNAVKPQTAVLQPEMDQSAPAIQENVTENVQILMDAGAQMQQTSESTAEENSAVASVRIVLPNVKQNLHTEGYHENDAGAFSQDGNLREAAVKTEFAYASKPAGQTDHEAGAKSDSQFLNFRQSDKKDDITVNDSWQNSQHPLFRNLDIAPVKVSESAIPAKQTQSVAGQVLSGLQKGIAAGERKIQLQLTPQNLGKIRIELTQKEDGSLHIALQAEHSEVREMLAKGLPEMQQMLRNTTGQEVQIHVPEQQENEQQFYDRQDQQNRENRQNQQQEQKKTEHKEDFLNQLRLGLIPQAVF